MPNDLTGEFDVCVQLSRHAVDMVVASRRAPVAANRPVLVPRPGRGDAMSPDGAPAPADDVVSRVRLLGEVLDELAAQLPSPGALRIAGIGALADGASVFANVGDGPPPDAPLPAVEVLLVDGDGLAIALSRDCVESVISQAVSGVSLPNRFEVRLRGTRGAGLVRWQVTVDLAAAETVLHGQGPAEPGYEDMPPSVLVTLPGTAVARGIGSLYADLDFTFELLVPFVPEIAADRIVFRPGEAQFRLLRVPIALDPFRSKIVTTVRHQLSVIDERISSPTTLDLTHVANALHHCESDLRLTLRGIGIRGGALVLWGRLESSVLSPCPPDPTRLEP